MTPDRIRQSFHRQAAACGSLGSPFTARVCRLHAERLQPGTPVADRILQWSGDPSPSADSVPLRIAGSLHALVLEGRSPPLAAAYPPNMIEDDSLWSAIAAAEQEHAGFILNRLNSAPQTNEVRRSGALLPGFMLLGKLHGKPLVLSEVGASAGLNLQWDRYRYDLGGQSFGTAESPVLIAPEWRGSPAPSGAVTVAARAGCDLFPVNAADPAHRLRMLSYIWADQSDRLARTKHALDIAALENLEVEKADAVDWLHGRLETIYPGRTHVIYHTIAWQYLPAPLQQAGEALIAAAGARATAKAPLARLSLEADDNPDGAALTLQTWPSGEKKLIGRGDFHGRWVDWRGW
ncbi:MAG: DUF2332 family protein [Rhizobium sp.]|nr:DUF2332 family protein [Rhizobium sp.]